MALRLKCACGKTLQIADDLAGKSVRCPHCKNRIAVPSADDADDAPYSLAGQDPADPPTRRLTVMETGRPHDCPSCSRPRKAREVVCLECGWHALEGRRLTTQSAKGYEDFRTWTLQRLHKLKDALADADETDSAALCKLLAGARKEFQACAPPETLLARDDLSPLNRSALEALAEAAPRLAELTAADLALADWGLESEDAHDQAGRRVGLLLDVVLCLARRSDRERSLAVTVAGSRATPNALGRDAMDRCRKALRKRLHAAGASRCEFEDLGDQSDRPTRRLELDITIWEEGVQLGTGHERLTVYTSARYTDPEGPSGRVDWKKTVECGAQREKIGNKYKEWAGGIVGSLPPEALRGYDTWAGAEIQCPCCGHAGLSTEKAPEWILCWSCGRDAVTGCTSDVLDRRKSADTSLMVAVALIAVGILIAIGGAALQWLTEVLPAWGLGLVVLVGGGMLLWGIVQCVLANNAGRRAAEEQDEQQEELKFPDAAKANRKTLDAAAGKASSQGGKDQEEAE